MPRVVVGITGLWWYAVTVNDFGYQDDLAYGWTERQARRRCLRKHNRRVEALGW